MATRAIFSSVKDAVGWYAAFRKGPALAQGDYSPRVQETPLDSGGLWIELASMFSRVCMANKVDLEDILRWGCAADGGVPRPGPKTMRALRDVLDEAGLLVERVERVECDPYTFKDLNTGLMVTTKRAKPR